MRKITIQDVAERAGVSVATVDRVLNRRPGVRPQTVARVEDAITALNYQPDQLAARLARGRDYRFCFLLPQGPASFMQQLADEVEQAAERARRERVTIDLKRGDVFAGPALARQLEELGEFYDGIAVVALDHPAVREAIDGLSQRGVAVVTLVSDVPSSRRVHFAGIDNVAAGRTAASLMGRFAAGRSGAIGLIAGSTELRDHIERQAGFEQVMQHEYPQLHLLPLVQLRDDWQRVADAVAELVASHGDLIGLYNIGGGNRGFVPAVAKVGRAAGIIAIAHDLTAPTRKGLVEGTLAAVINQDAGHEVRSAVRVLLARCENVPLNAAQERIRIDVYVRDNLP